MAYPDVVDMSRDYLTWVNTVTVTYLSKTVEAVPALTATTPRISHVLWNQIRKDRLAGDSILQKYDRTFRIAKLEAKGIVPKENDIIVDDLGLRWKAELVEVVCYGWEFRVHTTAVPIQGVRVGGPKIQSGSNG